jgi:protein-disulfide isomerase
MNRKIFSALLAGLLTVALCAPAFGDALTKEQGDAILRELKQIRQMLERQQKGEAPQPSAAQEKVKLKLGREFAMGQSDAQLVMVEYTDYQCPFCNRFYTATFPELKKRYIDTGKLRFITRDFPLDFHPQAMKAAHSTRCAGEQEKFWQMKESLMTNFSRLTPELITSLARDTGLDVEKFQACMESGKYQTDIKDGIAAATAVGISGTPSFVIGRVNGEYLEGYRIVGAQPFPAFESVIREILAGAEQK